jgi:hypothetical protein
MSTLNIGDRVRIVVRQAGSLRKSYEYGFVVDRAVAGETTADLPPWANDGEVWLEVVFDGSDGQPLWVANNNDIEGTVA